MKKRCPICNKVKKKSEFNKRTARKVGVQSVCRRCQNERDRGLYHSSDDRKRKVLARKAAQQERLRKVARGIRENSGCKYCDEQVVECLQFHHRDCAQKELEISRAVRRAWSIDRFLREVGKCDVVCANCHIKVHMGIIGA